MPKNCRENMLTIYCHLYMYTYMHMPVVYTYTYNMYSYFILFHFWKNLHYFNKYSAWNYVSLNIMLYKYLTILITNIKNQIVLKYIPLATCIMILDTKFAMLYVHYCPERSVAYTLKDPMVAPAAAGIQHFSEATASDGELCNKSIHGLLALITLYWGSYPGCR